MFRYGNLWFESIQEVSILGVILTFGQRVPFKFIVEEERFRHLDDVWIREEPFNNRPRRTVNAMKEDLSGSGTVLDDESMWITDETLVIKLEK